MATAMPTRTLDDVAYYVEPDFECKYFEVSYTDPVPTLNLFISTRINSWQERNFEDMVINELRVYNMTHTPIHCAVIYSLTPLKFKNLRKGRLVFDGKVSDEDFGPFYAARYIVGQ